MEIHWNIIFKPNFGKIPWLELVLTQMENGMFSTSKHSHKKRKYSLETRAELAVLRIYVENQAILEPILL